MTITIQQPDLLWYRKLQRREAQMVMERQTETKVWGMACLRNKCSLPANGEPLESSEALWKVSEAAALRGGKTEMKGSVAQVRRRT